MADGNRSQFSDAAAVVIVPLPAQGHLNQLLHLGCRIAAQGVPVHYLAGPAHLRQAENRAAEVAGGGIHFHNLPDIPFENLSPDPFAPHKFPSQIVPALMAAATHHRRPVLEYVQRVSGGVRKVVVIYDALMSHVVQDVGSIANAEAYVFQSMSAFTVCAWSAELLPELFTVQDDLLKQAPSVCGYHSKEFGEFLELQKNAKKIFVGEIYNSNDAIEGSYLDLLKAGGRNIWGLGPFHFLPSQIRVSKNPNRCLAWLDEQKEPHSVIYVSFGTTVSFTDEQIREIAIGLERSGQKFLWVVRDADKGNIFSGTVRKIALPDGFEDRVRDRGLVVKDWAPQLEILGHASVGGFMTHCGWNSCVESISMGVAMAVWPLHSDQPANAILITKVARIGIEVTAWTPHNELVGSDTVEKAVRKFMGQEGADVRERAKKLGEVVRDSIEEGGSTWRTMKLFVDQINN